MRIEDCLRFPQIFVAPVSSLLLHMTGFFHMAVDIRHFFFRDELPFPYPAYIDRAADRASILPVYSTAIKADG